MRTKPTRILVLGVAFVVCSCDGGTSNTSSSPENGGSVGSGGNSVTATGGSRSPAIGGGGTNPTGGSATGGVATGGSSGGSSSGGGTTTAQHEAFELRGTWLYLGPGDLMHTLQVSDESMVYKDIAGEWSSNWTIKGYDNSLHRFQLIFESGTGTYYPVGENISGTYVVNSAILTAQLANGLGSYPPMQNPESCTDENSNRIADCGLYMSEQ
jgi:hypothetical protein